MLCVKYSSAQGNFALQMKAMCWDPEQIISTRGGIYMDTVKVINNTGVEQAISYLRIEQFGTLPLGVLDTLWLEHRPTNTNLIFKRSGKYWEWKGTLSVPKNSTIWFILRTQWREGKLPSPGYTFWFWADYMESCCIPQNWGGEGTSIDLFRTSVFRTFNFDSTSNAVVEQEEEIVEIWGSHGVLYISTSSPQQVWIYEVTGRFLGQFPINGRWEKRLLRGAYVVVIGDGRLTRTIIL